MRVCSDTLALSCYQIILTNSAEPELYMFIQNSPIRKFRESKTSVIIWQIIANFKKKKTTSERVRPRSEVTVNP